MAKYRNKPVIVEAYRVWTDNIDLVAEWCGGQVKGVKLPINERCIDIQTLEGEIRVEIGDYIIKGVKGEFYPCKFEMFKMTYELVG